MRLYRGLTKPYRPELVKPVEGRVPIETDFTDCPYTALRYAGGRRGVVLVLEVGRAAMYTRVIEESWPGAGEARRFIAWGRFDKLMVGAVPAKKLRARVRSKGVAASSDKHSPMFSGTPSKTCWPPAQRRRRGELSHGPCSRSGRGTLEVSRCPGDFGNPRWGFAVAALKGALLRRTGEAVPAPFLLRARQALELGTARGRLPEPSDFHGLPGREGGGDSRCARRTSVSHRRPGSRHPRHRGAATCRRRCRDG